MSKESNDFVAFTIDGKDYHQSDVIQTFKQVAPKDNWKNPIDAKVAIKNGHDLEVLLRSIAFLTGSVAEAVPAGEKRNGNYKKTCTIYRIRADGYYLSIGA